MPKVTVLGADVEVLTQAHETVLAALCRSGYAHKVGCRRGGCGLCRLDLLDGSVTYPTVVAESVLPEAERQEACLSCRAVPVTDVVVRLRDDDRLRVVAPLLVAIAQAAAKAGSS